jgi:hypothetical protein
MGQNDPDIQIEIKTTGAAQAKKEVQDLAKEAKGLGEAYKSAGGGLKGLTETGKEAAQIFNKAGGGMSGLGAVISSAGAAIIGVMGGVAGAVAFATKAIHEFAGGEEVFTKVEQALANQGRLTEAYSRKLKQLASDMQEATAIADEKWLAVLEQLTKHGAAPENIVEYTDAVKNLAGLMGGDVEDAARVFTRAMHGNFEMLHRLGIEVKDNVSQHEKLIDVQKQLAEMGGGILEARLKTVNGSFATLSLTVSDFFKAVGGVISQEPLFHTALGGLIGMTRTLIKAFPEAAINADLFKNKMPSVKAAVDDAVPSLRDAGSAIQDIGKDYADAAKAADAFRQQEEEAADLQLADQIAQVENKLARHAIDQPAADAQIKILRDASLQRTSQQRLGSFETERKDLLGKQSASFNAMTAAEGEAGQKSGKVAELLKFADRYFGIKPEQANDQRFIEQYLAQNAKLGIKTPELEKLATIPAAIDAERSAKQKLEISRNANTQTLNQTEPRLTELERLSQNESLRLRTAKTQTDTDVVKISESGINVRSLTGSVLQSTGALRGQLQELGAAIRTKDDTILQILNNLTRQVQETERRANKSRNN